MKVYGIEYAYRGGTGYTIRRGRDYTEALKEFQVSWKGRAVVTGMSVIEKITLLSKLKELFNKQP